MASFVRQLNKYDFHKIKSNDEEKRQYSEQAWEFQHPKFQLNRRDLLEEIKRKIPTPRNRSVHAKADEQQATDDSSPDDGTSNVENTTTVDPAIPDNANQDLRSQVEHLTVLHAELAGQMNVLSKNCGTVLEEIIAFRRNLAAQDNLLNNLYQILVTKLSQERLQSRQFQGSSPSHHPSVSLNASASSTPHHEQQYQDSGGHSTGRMQSHSQQLSVESSPSSSTTSLLTTSSTLHPTINLSEDINEQSILSLNNSVNYKPSIPIDMSNRVNDANLTVNFNLQSGTMAASSISSETPATFSHQFSSSIETFDPSSHINTTNVSNQSPYNLSQFQLRQYLPGPRNANAPNVSPSAQTMPATNRVYYRGRPPLSMSKWAIQQKSLVVDDEACDLAANGITAVNKEW